jgi:hypothetical protein
MAFVLDRQGAHDILCSKNATRKGIKRHKVNQKQFNQSLQQELCLEPCRNQDPWSQLSDGRIFFFFFFFMIDLLFFEYR